MLALREVPRATCGDVVTLATRKVEQIDGKLRDLRSMRRALNRLLKDCTGTAPITRCPIIESLARSGNAPRTGRLAPSKEAPRGRRTKS